VSRRYIESTGVPTSQPTRAPRSKRAQKWPPSISGGLFGTPIVLPMVEPPVSYLESMVPAAAYEMAIVLATTLELEMIRDIVGF